MSLGHILQVAVRQAPSLASATIDVAIADARLTATQGIEDWLLAASLGWLRRRDETVAGNVTGTDKLDRYTVEATLSKLLPTGARIGITASGAHSTTLFAFGGGDEATEVSSSVIAFISQPLLGGRGSDVTLASQYRARSDLDAAQMQRVATARTLVRDIIDAYWALALAYRDLGIRQSSLDLAKEQRRITEASVKLGQVAQTELTAVDQAIATREADVVVAGLAVTERAIELRRLAGLEIGAQAIDLRPTASLDVEPQKFDLNLIVERALSSSAELAALRAQGEGAVIDIQVAENGLLPRADLNLSGGPIGTAEDVNGSLENLSKFKGYTVAGSLDIQYAFGRHAAIGDTRAAHARFRQIKVNERDLSAQIALSAVRAVREANSAAARIALGQRAIELAKANVEAEKQRFELGRSTNFDVLLRQEDLKEARLSLARASADYLVATTFIEALTGTILERHGIKLEPKKN